MVDSASDSSKRTKPQKRHDRNVENSKVDLKGAAAAEEAVWVVAAATPGVEDGVTTATPEGT